MSNQGVEEIDYTYYPLRITDEWRRIEAAYRWIPVAERAPEDGKAVLIASEGVNCWIGRFNNGRCVGATHWMPLPEPPKINT